MFHWTVLQLFLYFPEDKTEYIPAAISFSIFLIAAILTMRFIVKKSKKDEEKTKALEEKILQQRDQNKEAPRV
ncbi:hypothetical protein [Robertmurraya andreesenii]|uniref:Uncharacterized protein n=1 Tax=Anoxybacillus andreesenii TaxID=1325932 RepID=A0ABT9V331_9BACL|nr:hypothetical protein [Robertmurraya andreesenii]MDQ0155341.1 hypothetical protein [Robertmurraya andreesenii]